MKTNILFMRMATMRIERTQRYKSKKSYEYWSSTFSNWLTAYYPNCTIEEFTKGLAHQYLDYLTIERKLGNCTVNSHKGFVSGCFQELVYREYISKNPFEGIPDRRVIRQKRDAFQPEEVRWLLSTIKREDPHLYLFVLLVYGTLIRPIEVTRLRYGMLDLTNSMVHLPAEITKTWSDGHPTLPSWIVKEMRKLGVDRKPKEYLIFGKGFTPHPDKSCGHHTPNRRHKYFIDKGKRLRLLRKQACLSLYSWKYTAGDEYAKVLNPYELKAQMRHKRIETTMLYLNQQAKVITGVKHHKPV